MPNIAPTELTDRQRSLLRGVVEQHIATGQPVGSKTLVERTGLRVSSSTVRPQLAELEALGPLTPPHTTAARAPRPARLVVDGPRRPRRARSARPAHPPAHLGRARADGSGLPLLRRRAARAAGAATRARAARLEH